MALIPLLIAVALFCLVIWAVRSLLAAFGIGPPISVVINVAIVVLFVLWLIQVLGFSGPVLRLR